MIRIACLSDMKTCFKCGAEKPLSEFYKHSGMKDGRVNKCKDCNKRDVIENRKKRAEYYKHYDRNRPNHSERVRKQTERTKELYQSCGEFREKVNATQAAWVNRNPDKRKAHNSVNNAIRDGILHKPDKCEHCEEVSDKIQGHHWSYEEEHWLDVMWLCPACHGKEHRRLNELGRDPDN